MTKSRTPLQEQTLFLHNSFQKLAKARRLLLEVYNAPDLTNAVSQGEIRAMLDAINRVTQVARELKHNLRNPRCRPTKYKPIR